MPLKGYIKTCNCPATFSHPNSMGKEVECVPLDHYAFTCPEPPMPRILAKALYKDTQGERYAGVNGPLVSPSRLTRCPLQTYLEATEPYVIYAIDPGSTKNDRRFMLRGTFAHKGLLDSLRGDPDFLVEQPFKMDLGVPFYFTPDAYELPTGTLYDLKTQSVFAVDKKAKQSDEAILKDEYVNDNVRQVNMYGALLEQMGFPVKRIELQYWDGDMRVRRLNVPMKDGDKIRSWIKEQANLMYKILTGEVPLANIPAKPLKESGFSPQKSSGVYYLLKQELDSRKAAA